MKEEQLEEVVICAKLAYDILDAHMPQLCSLHVGDRGAINSLLGQTMRLGRALNAVNKLGKHVTSYDYAPPKEKP